jgi:7-carboxy-7-deazaguanine synthase
MYKVKEIFTTIQGEGFNVGKAAVFLRFAGCNLWNGLESGRSIGAGSCSKWCDTDFVGGENFKSANSLVEIINSISENIRFIICTGGEPLLQLDKELSNCLRQNGYYVAIETNGSIKLDFNVNWICVAPKAGIDLKLTYGNELKLIYPQFGVDPQDYIQEYNRFDYYYLQPLDDQNKERNTVLAVEYVKKHPKWRLSLQTHKFINIP